MYPIFSKSCDHLYKNKQVLNKNCNTVAIDSFTYELQTPDLSICNLSPNAKLNVPLF